MREDPRHLRRADLFGERVIGMEEPVAPVAHPIEMTEHRAALPLRQTAPHAEVGFRLQGIREALESHLALQAAQTDLPLRRALNE